MPSFSKLLSAAVVVIAAVCVDASDEHELTWNGCGSYYCGELHFHGRPADDWARELSGRNVPHGARNVNWMYGYSTSRDGSFYPGYGPTIRFKPGRNYKLTVYNRVDKIAPYDVASMVTTDGVDVQVTDVVSAASNNGGKQSLHSTSLHMHGLHISGQGDHDNVGRYIEPGQGLQYIYNIPSNHQPGHFWYRPHGMASHQIIAGAFGSCIVEDAEPGFGSSGVTASGHGIDNNVQRFLSNRLIERHLHAYYGAPLYMGNGDHRGAQFDLGRNQWYRLRVHHVAPELTVTQGVFQFSKEVGNGCSIYELGADGVYYENAPYQQYGKPNIRTSVAGALYPYTSSFPVHSHGRLDFAVRCSRNGNFHYQFGGGQVGHFRVGDVAVAGNNGGENPFHGGSQQWRPSRGPYMSDLRDGRWGGNWKLHSGYPVHVGNDGINGKMYSESSALASFPYGPSDIQEFVYMNTGSYGLHLHQHHVQIVQPGGCGGAYRYGHFYDTVSSFDGSDCRVRVRFMDYSGPTHFGSVGHEYKGIRGWYNVPKGGWEAGGFYSDHNTPFDDCVSRRNDANALICRSSLQCGSDNGWDTCNQACSWSQSCGGSYQCSGSGHCYN